MISIQLKAYLCEAYGGQSIWFNRSSKLLSLFVSSALTLTQCIQEVRFHYSKPQNAIARHPEQYTIERACCCNTILLDMPIKSQKLPITESTILPPAFRSPLDQAKVKVGLDLELLSSAFSSKCKKLAGLLPAFTLCLISPLLGVSITLYCGRSVLGRPRSTIIMVIRRDVGEAVGLGLQSKETAHSKTTVINMGSLPVLSGSWVAVLAMFGSFRADEIWRQCQNDIGYEIPSSIDDTFYPSFVGQLQKERP